MIFSTGVQEAVVENLVVRCQELVSGIGVVWLEKRVGLYDKCGEDSGE